ncbi:hypothetical protein [Listeria booriae]|uniref:Uncharacterized protein n=1 Tax=Listeria booriae TaxID=1552123 RepID=A0A842FYS4_9LIST|nr:hypothetical protein [Listeria booriae]MBC2292949.1 hypothetical protein [Listeria booriae]MBC2676243.1 hypothetical protein [Listeria booriae]
MTEDKWMCAPKIYTECWGAEEFNTKEEAIAAGRKAATEKGKLAENVFGYYCNPDVPINDFAVGRMSEPALYIPVDSLLEDIAENVYEQVGEAAETYLDDVTKDDKQKLEDIIRNWLVDNNYLPSCFLITDIEKVEVNTYDTQI